MKHVLLKVFVLASALFNFLPVQSAFAADDVRRVIFNPPQPVCPPSTVVQHNRALNQLLQSVEDVNARLKMGSPINESFYFNAKDCFDKKKITLEELKKLPPQMMPFLTMTEESPYYFLINNYPLSNQPKRTNFDRAIILGSDLKRLKGKLSFKDAIIVHSNLEFDPKYIDDLGVEQETSLDFSGACIVNTSLKGLSILNKQIIGMKTLFGKSKGISFDNRGSKK